MHTMTTAQITVASLPKTHWALIHYRGCRQIAFVSIVEPKPFQTIRREDCRWPNGSPIIEDAPIHCGYCLRYLSEADLQTRYIEQMN